MIIVFSLRSITTDAVLIPFLKYQILSCRSSVSAFIEKRTHFTKFFCQKPGLNYRNTLLDKLAHILLRTKYRFICNWRGAYSSYPRLLNFAMKISAKTTHQQNCGHNAREEQPSKEEIPKDQITYRLLGPLSPSEKELQPIKEH